MAYSAGVAILISLLAGMATVVGGAVSLVFASRMKPITFAAALAFAAGCTLTVAFADVLPEGQEAWNRARGAAEGEEEKDSSVGLLVMLFGWLVASSFDRLLHFSLDAYDHCTGATEHVHVGVCAHDHGHDHSHGDTSTSQIQQEITLPMVEHGHSHTLEEESERKSWWKKLCSFLLSFLVGTSHLSVDEQKSVDRQFYDDAKKISRLGYFTACVLALHNIPEGIALYGTLASDERSGLGLAIAISLHNLPQGMAVAVPIYIGLNSKWKAILFSVAAALAQPLGAVLGYGIVGVDPSDSVMCIMLLLTAGVLFNASLKELYASAVRYDRGNQVCGPFIFIGMLVMSATLIGLAYL